MALIHRRVNEMGFAWHPRAQLDFGIDGEIELADPRTRQALNALILVQSKASDQPFQRETDAGFRYYCKPRDVEYWMYADLPVILVCSHPAKDEAWWIDVKAWFSDTSRRKTGRVDFDKPR